MVPLSTRDTTQRGSLSVFNQIATIMMSGILVALIFPMVIMPYVGVDKSKWIVLMCILSIEAPGTARDHIYGETVDARFVPTYGMSAREIDCPTRERHGWTGDAQIFVNTASYFFDYAAFARKYTADMTDGQRKNGCFRQITPMGGIDRYMNVMDGSAGWSDAGILIPYRIYKRYGDADILKDNYASMHRYIEYKIKTLGRRYITGRPTGIERRYRKYIFNYGQSYGEWAEPADVNAMRISDFVSPHPEETTAYIVYILECMAEIAALLGEDDDAGRYGELAGKVRAGYQALSRTAILRGRKAVNTPSAGPAAEHKPVVILTLCLKRGFIPLLKGLYCY